jgi:anionic cell wall polymer biosynthesis LytR-Cps2A-Psr (LCP) family protein
VKKSIITTIILTVLLASGYYFWNKTTAKNETQTIDNAISDSTKNHESEVDTAFLKSVFELDDSYDYNSDSLLTQGEDNTAGLGKDEFAGQTRINIALIGLDGRMGATTGHADANHILSIMPDIGKIQIISIPRDTYVDCGYDDTTHLNKLTVYYMAAGRQSYLQKLAEIAKLPSIPYYIEFGFSQAMGMMSLFGYKSTETLQVLRSRKSFAIGDYQRVYNQAQFVKQLMVRHYNTLTGTFQPVFINGILVLVKTNMKNSEIANIFSNLEQNNFTASPENISIKIRPSLKANYKVFDFSNPEMIVQMKKQLGLDKIAKRDTSAFTPTDFTKYLENKLSKIIIAATKDTLKNPQLTINKLKPTYEQKIWLQFDNDSLRNLYSKKMSDLLQTAYLRRKDTLSANRVKVAYIAEQDLFTKSKVQ